MKEKIIAKIMSGKWFMTVTFTATTCYLALIGKIPVELFVPLVTMIVTSYFNRDKEPKKVE